MGCHGLLLGIFLTLGLNPRLLYRQAGSSPLRPLAWLCQVCLVRDLWLWPTGSRARCLTAPSCPTRGSNRAPCKAESQPLNQQGSPWKWSFKEVTGLPEVTTEGPELV